MTPDPVDERERAGEDCAKTKKIPRTLSNKKKKGNTKTKKATYIPSTMVWYVCTYTSKYIMTR